MVRACWFVVVGIAFSFIFGIDEVDVDLALIFADCCCYLLYSEAVNITAQTFICATYRRSVAWLSCLW